MLLHKVLIFKLVPINGKASGSIPFQKVTSLNHKVFDDPMKRRSLVAHRSMVHSMLARTQLSEILGCSVFVAEAMGKLVG